MDEPLAITGGALVAPQAPTASSLSITAPTGELLKPNAPITFGTPAAPVQQKAAPAPVIAAPKPAPTPAPTQTAKPITAISSNGAKDTIATNTTKLASLADKGQYADGQGVMHYADGSLVPAPTTNTGQSSNGLFYDEAGHAYGAAPASSGTTTDANGNAVTTGIPPAEQAILDQMKATTDASTKRMIDSIEQSYNALKQQQADINARYSGAIDQQLMQGGSSRYAVSSNGIEAGAATYGLQQLQQLESKEQAAIAEAQAAGDKQDYETLGKQLDLIDKLRVEKQDAAKALNQKLLADTAQATKDNQISSLYSSGTTDPTAILSALQAAGNKDITLADVSDAIKNIIPPGIDDLVKTARQNGAPASVVQSILSAKDANGAYAAAGSYGAGGTGIIGEYNYAKANGYTGSFSDYQNADANRKKSVTNVYSGTGAPGTLSTEAQAWLTAVKNGNATMTNVPTAIRSEVAIGLANTDQASYSPLAASRFTTAATKIVSNFEKLPQYQLTANGLPYLQRIDAAMKTPGSVSDQDLLDSLTKLNTAGNAITDAQVRLITDGKSFTDSIATFGNKFKNGGVLSDNQRQQIQSIAQAIYANYAKGYQPVYDQVTKQLTDAGIPQPFWTIPDLNALSDKGGYGNATGIAQTDVANQSKIADWVTQSNTNQTAYEKARSVFPEATTDELMQQLGIQ